MQKSEKKILELATLNKDQPSYLEPVFVKLKGHPHFDEKWLQDRIAENPKILGLGDVETLDRERRQPRAGRLDLLLQNIDNAKRYTVELQLGATDESHVIRTIEYWDIERKRYPHYDHCAVIVAEEITGRFLNVVSLFNSHIPLIAIQLKAVQMGDTMGLVFTKVLDEIETGVDEEEARDNVETNRQYWENRSSPEMLSNVDSILRIVNTFAPGYELKYNKFYIGLTNRGKAQNFIAFKPQKKAIRVEIGMELLPEMVTKLEAAGIEVFPFIPRWSLHPIRLMPKDISQHEKLLVEIMKASFDNYFS